MPLPESRPELAASPDAASVTPASILGIGCALPQTRIASSEIAGRLGLEPGWIERRTGIRHRRREHPETGVLRLATRAGQRALAAAGVEAAELDLVLVATLCADDLTPGAAPQVATALGAGKAGAFDIGAACNGFISALATAAGMIESGRAGRVLVIGAEVMSRFLDHADRRTAGLFGDGAGAAVVGAGGSGRIGRILLEGDGEAWELIRVKLSDRLLRMDGHATFLRAVAALTASTRELLEHERLDTGDIDLFVYHQANGRILSAVADRLGVDDGRVLDVIAETGNTSAASIPLALGEAIKTGRLQPGMRVVLGAVGAGLLWGTCLVEWGGA